MSTLPYPAAPLDRTARILTRLTWTLAAVLSAIGAILIAAGVVSGGVVLLAVAVLDGVLCVVYRRLEPVAYRVEESGVTIERRFAGPYSVPGHASLVPGASLGLRTMGSGGLYGYLGRFRLAGAATGSVRAFVTDRSRTVVVDVDGGRVAVSPLDRDLLLAELAGG